MNAQRLLRRTEDVLATVMDLWKRPPTPQQRALAHRLIADLTAASERANGGSAFWQDICVDLRQRTASEDPRYFMRWEPIRATMVHGAAPITFRMLSMLRHSDAWRSVWAPALRHQPHGHPPPFPPMLSTSAMSIEHAGHLFRFRQFAARDLYDADCIIEFGGGFGSMCRLVRALGFRGRYIVFDLPPVLALQRYFLGLNGIEATLDAPSNTWLCPDLSEIRTELARSRPNRVALISTWALSEMPLAIRHEIEAFFALPAACMALLAYQPSFEGNDNHAWFHGLMERTGDRWRWNERPVDTVDRPPIPGDSLYVFGVAR